MSADAASQWSSVKNNSRNWSPWRSPAGFSGQSPGTKKLPTEPSTRIFRDALEKLCQSWEVSPTLRPLLLLMLPMLKPPARPASSPSESVKRTEFVPASAEVTSSTTQYLVLLARSMPGPGAAVKVSTASEPNGANDDGAVKVPTTLLPESAGPPWLLRRISTVMFDIAAASSSRANSMPTLVSVYPAKAGPVVNDWA